MAATKSRYLGVQPFKTSDQDLFFGRNEDIENLHDFILLEKLVVLFGKSGYGKSSLLNAGIMPRLLDERQPPAFRFRPIEVRFTDYDEKHSIPPQETLKRLLGVLPADPAADFLNGLGLDDTLWVQFKRRQTAADGQFVLLFDQFEEFFSYPSDQQEAFRRQLAELLYTDIPRALRGQLDALDEDARRYLARPMQVKAVFAIRSDRMSQLDSMKDVLPAILHKRYELRPLTTAQARDAIVQPAGIAGAAFNSPPFEYTEGGLQAILQALTSKTAAGRDGDTAGIEAFQLQILCEYLESRVREGLVPDLDDNGLPDISEAELPEMDTLYENYYYRKLGELPVAEREKAQRVLEDALLAEDAATGEGRRKSVDRLDLLGMGLSESLLDALEKTYLIRRELNTVGGYNYELSHDTLLAPVLKAKKKRVAEEEAQKRAAELAAEEARIAREKAEADRRRKRALLTSLVAALLVLAAVVATIFAFNKSLEAEREAENARKAVALADEKTRQAAESDSLAQVKTADATAAEEAARLQKEIAELKSREAQTATDQALLRKKEAELAALQAVLALFPQIRRDILLLDYSAAFSKVKNAASLNTNALKDSLAFESMEVAWFHHHSGHDDLAREPYNLAADLLGKNSLKGRLDFEKLDAARAQFLKARYFGEMVALKGGSFQMQDKYEVAVADFQLSKYETTVWQYNLFCVAKGRSITQRISTDGKTIEDEKYQPSWGWVGNNPVVYVSWYDAVEYANWLSVQMGKQPAYVISTEQDSLNETSLDDFNWTITPVPKANGFRLPTELEWEFAARGGIQRDVFEYSGSDSLDLVAWYDDNSDSHTQPVGVKKINGAGIFDMSGNVWEWCYDWYGDLPAENAFGARKGSFRVVRGGSWNFDPEDCRVANRRGDDPVFRYNNVGFRLVFVP
ncbi:MAG: SUMF1/EgtB/PvdO family nonheme iron enzyme [Saprospiraceae bacterium]